jgi:preprotein translocase subunit SecG
MLTTILDVIHIGACAVLMFVVLLQQGKGGGLGAAFGGGAAAQVFGGRGAGNILTRATAVCAGIFMLTSVSLAYLSSSGDRALKAKAAQEAQKKPGEKGTARPKETKADPKPTDTPPAPPASAP